MSKAQFNIKLLITLLLLSSSGGNLLAAGTPAKLDMDMDWPKKMYFHKPLQGVVSQAHSATGASASTTASAAENEGKDKKADIQKIESLGVDYKKIVRDSFIEEMKAKGIYDDSSSNKLKLKVVLYGYSHKGGFNINMVPMLKVKAKLEDPTGKKLWKGTGGVSVFGKAVANAEYYDLLKSRETAEAMFVAAAEKVAKKALKKYK